VRTASTAVPDQIVGHRWVLDLLARSQAAGSVPHACLLVGPAHIGKFTTALVMAQRLLCEHGTRCGACRHCALAARRAHPDLRVLEIPAERKNIPLADVHEFLRGIALRPLEAERKVYIIRGAEDLAEDGANALLKVIEEPPPTVTILLTAPEPAALLPTIVSRCQVVRLRPAPAEEIAAYLEAQFGLTPEQAHLIARASKGRPGWAVLAAKNPELIEERQTRARELLALLSAGRLERIAHADAIAERWSGHADEVREVLDAWMELWRDVLISSYGAGERISNGYLTAEIQSLARTLPLERARQALAATIAMVDALERNAHPRLALESYALRLPRHAGP
jgi:DNA polymerase-3 subunit delta'